jgi:hypothetical protein
VIVLYSNTKNLLFLSILDFKTSLTGFFFYGKEIIYLDLKREILLELNFEKIDFKH